MAMDGSITVVVVTWEGRELTLAALASLRRQTAAHRVLVVDNASTDGTAQAIADSYPEVDVLTLATNAGFAGGVAAAMARIDTQFVALLNNDAVADPQWLEASLAPFSDPSVAAVTAKLLLAQGPSDHDAPTTINNAGVVLLESGYGADRGLGHPDGPEFDQAVEVFGFSGGASMLRTLAVKAVGGIRADYFMYYEDTELSWRLREAGWRIVYAPGAVVTHAHGASAGPMSRMFAHRTEGNRLRMLWSHAPVGFAAGATARFVVTTASLTAQELRGRAPATPVLDPHVRWGVLSGVVRDLPRLIAARPRTGRRASRRRLLRQWRGVPARPWET